MNNNQKQRIMQVSETTLIVGTDIAKVNHVARAQDFRGIELGKRLLFQNTRDGLDRLVQWIRTLQDEHCKEDVILGLEPTGHYWLPLAEFLHREGIKVVLVNPYHVKKSKELDDNSPTKNDIKDARVIAQLVKDGRYSEPNLLTGIHAELRVAMVQRERLNKELIRVKGRVTNWLDRFFPEYPQVFKKWDGKASIATLKQFPLPQDILKLESEAIVTKWKADVQRAVGIKRAQLLIEQARSSIGLTSGLTSARYELRQLLEQHELLYRQMEELMAYIEDLVSQIPGSKEMKTIPGVGWVTVAGFLAEVGDLTGYDHPQQIIKLAGLNLKENSSGKHKGQSTITKRGRPQLRALLFRCVLPLVAKNSEFQRIHRYLTTRQINPLKKKQSLIALCGRLIRILFTLGIKRIPYNPQKVLSTVHLEQLAA